ncbi:MAG: hypothetical protein K5Q00_07415, partial [Gammaproteobacteria bacterium]|nr:hypothetical protein [Gammaproteobacteria bacterium]
QLANASFEDPNSLDPIAKSLQLQVKTTPMFSKSGAASGIAKLPQVVSTAFSDDVLAGENSDVITLSPTEVAIVRLSQHQPATTKPFDTVAPGIKTILTQMAIQQALQAQANTITQAYQAGASAAALAKQYNFSWLNAPNQARYAHSAVQPIIVQQAFNLARPGKSPTLGSVALPDSSYALVLLNKVTDASVDKKQVSIFSERMDKALGQVEYLEYVKYLHNKANVTTSAINDDND